MKQTIQFAVAIAVSAAAMFAYMYEPPPDRVVQEVGQAAPSPTHQYAPSVGSHPSSNQPAETPKRELTAAELADIDPASIDWESVSNRIYPGIDQMLLRVHGTEEYSPEEVAAFNKLHVIAFNPVTHDVCHEKENEYFVDGFATICDDVKERPDHPYASMDYEQLHELAESDAAAAVFASRKAERIEDRLGMALRAAALSGKPGPILATAAKEYVTPLRAYTEDNKIASRRDTVPSTVVGRIILESVAQKMGDPRANPDAWHKHIDDFAKTQDQKEKVLEAINRAARQAMESMALIQQEVTGSTQVRELLDA
jgi:hypothetical protein